MGQPLRKVDEIESRRATVADLYLNGWQITRIAQHMNMDRSTIHADINAIKQQWIENQSQSYGERVAKELEYTDHLAAKIAHRVDMGDVGAIQTAIRIQERRAKYLALDQPTRVVVDDRRVTALRELAEQLGVLELPEVKELLSGD